MGLNKKDRRISIWIGIIIGVTLSSMLFRYAIKDKNERSLLRPGSYESNITAVENLTLPPIPDRVREAIPSGLVLYHESNHSISGNAAVIIKSIVGLSKVQVHYDLSVYSFWLRLKKAEKQLSFSSI